MDTPESAEVFDPTANRFERVGEPKDYTASAQSATLLADGKVLITGGDTGDPNDPMVIGPQRTAEVWNPGTGQFSRAGRMDKARRGHLGALLPDGRVIIVGGSGPRSSDFHDSARSSTEVWDPADRAFLPGPPLSVPRQRMAMVTLPDGSLLVVGGDTDTNARTGAVDALSTAELLDLSLTR
jgi:hypothetical protein